MLPHPDEIERAFDDLSIARMPAFIQLVSDGKLRYSKEAGSCCDVVDDYSIRLICECIEARSSLYLVWPDSADRRAPLALAAGVICDSLLHIGGETGKGRILYVGSDSSIKAQFAAVRVGNTPLGNVFAQEYGRGGSQLQRAGPESSLPIITTIVSPAEPDKIIKSLRPRWIAVDCGRGSPPPWLERLLAAAKAHSIPIIGWSTLHLSSVADMWRAQNGCVYRWPKVSGSMRHSSLADLSQQATSIVVTPMILDGQGSIKVSEELAQCYQRLSRHIGRASGQFAQDALSVAWRFLRLLESLPVPADLYDSECVNYWRMPSLIKLKDTLDRFVQATISDGALRSDLRSAYERLVTAYELLRDQSDPPLWIATANLAIEATVPSVFVFQNRAHCDLFRFSLLSKFNISEEDLRDVGVTLSALSDFSHSAHERSFNQVTLVGLPSRISEWRMESLLEFGDLRVIVWPHLEDTLVRRATEWSGKLSGGCEGTSPLRLAPAENPEFSKRFRFAGTQTLNLSGMKHSVRPLGSGKDIKLWKQPEAAEAISALFYVNEFEDTSNDGTVAVVPSLPEEEGKEASSQDDWVENALRVVIEDGAEILLPLDDFVNVITRSADGVNVVPRYTRSLRVGDEILLVHGEHRRSLYDLLLSRVHSHSTIAPWLLLVDRWHQDLRRAFLEAKRRVGITFERLLDLLQKQGSQITTTASVRGWIIGVTLAPSDWEDIRRLGDILDITIAKKHAREIGNAAGRLAGLHRGLSIRLNRWLASEDAGSAAMSGEQSIVDAELGLSIEDFQHSLVRGRIAALAQMNGPFLRSHIGHLKRVAP